MSPWVQVVSVATESIPRAEVTPVACITTESTSRNTTPVTSERRASATSTCSRISFTNPPSTWTSSGISCLRKLARPPLRTKLLLLMSSNQASSRFSEPVASPTSPALLEPRNSPRSPRRESRPLVVFANSAPERCAQRRRYTKSLTRLSSNSAAKNGFRF